VARPTHPHARRSRSCGDNREVATEGYPVLLDLRGRRVVVVGGGRVAARRVPGLVSTGADVVVVSPVLDAGLAELEPAVRLRPFRPDDLDGAWLVLACTDDPAVNAEVAAVAAARGTFCVRADDAAGGTARTLTSVHRDGVTVAVSGGDDPRRAVTLRDAIAAGIDTGTLPTRHARRPHGPGSVVLVGGGPGDPGLITVRGRREVADADVVVVDRLAPRALLADLPPEVEIIDSGKSAHRHNLSQDEINAVLVDRARAGHRVVRLKGGDPFVFGRGGEEWLACAAAGVPVTVVPGLSSALAAPALAAIPLTHRQVAADFTVVSGHLDPGRAADQGIDWPGLATHAGTLVVLMGMDRLELIAAELIRHGKDPATPAAAVHNASLPGERVVRGRLDELAGRAAAAGIGAPGVVVIGAVVGLLR